MSAQPHNKSYFKLVCEMALQYFIYIEFCLCESGLLFLLLNCFASSRYHIHRCQFFNCELLFHVAQANNVLLFPCYCAGLFFQIFGLCNPHLEQPL